MSAHRYLRTCSAFGWIWTLDQLWFYEDYTHCLCLSDTFILNFFLLRKPTSLLNTQHQTGHAWSSEWMHFLFLFSLWIEGVRFHAETKTTPPVHLKVHTSGFACSSPFTTNHFYFTSDLFFFFFQTMLQRFMNWELYTTKTASYLHANIGWTGMNSGLFTTYLNIYSV